MRAVQLKEDGTSDFTYTVYAMRSMISYLVSWHFEPSQSQRITLGLMRSMVFLTGKDLTQRKTRVFVVVFFS